jgi:PAS domain S-box-containing protein
MADLQLLLRISRSITSNLEPATVLNLIIQSATQVLEGNAGAIALWDDSRRAFVTQASFGFSPETLAALHPALDEAAQHFAGEEQSGCIVAALVPALEEPALSEALKFVIALPLKIHDRLIGMIDVFRTASCDEFISSDSEVLSIFAEHAAIAVRNAQLYQSAVEDRNRVEAIVRSSADGILSLDVNCLITGFNPALEHLTGWQAEEVVGRRCAAILNLLDAYGNPLCPGLCPVSGAVDGSRGPAHTEGVLTTRDGRTIDVGLGFSLIRTPDGQRVGAVVTIHDISQFRQLEEMKTTFLSIISHELQTPVAIIKGYASTLGREDASWNRQTLQRVMGIIEEESDRLSKLINNLLQLSRLQTEGIQLHKTYVQLPALIEKVARNYVTQSQKHHLKLQFPADFPEVLVDYERMREVFSNLIGNAIKYSPDGGVIALTGEVRDDEIRVRVRDQGIGIAGEDQERIFERFQRVDNGLSRRTEGTGLGLFICQTVVRAHRGRIELESEPGKGSCFTVVLPRDEDAEALTLLPKGFERKN